MTKIYTPADCTKDLAFTQGIGRLVLPFDRRSDGKEYVNEEKIDPAWRLLGQRYHRFAGRAFRDQVAAAVPDIYNAAQRRIRDFYQKKEPLFVESTLEEKLNKARAEGRVETLLGDEAEALGYCGCIPMIRIKQ